MTNRDFKFKKRLIVQNGFGFGFAISNTQPKSKYRTAWWELIIVFLCWDFRFELSYNYKPFKVKAVK